MMKNIALMLVLSLFTLNTSAQSVAINSDGSTADPSAILDLKSTNQGVLVPRLTAAQRTAITAPATGLMVYQTDAPAGFYFYNGTVWTSLSGNNTAGLVTGGTAGQILSKIDSTDYNTQWITLPAATPSQLELIVTADGANSYRLRDRVIGNYGVIGNDAVDLSYSDQATSNGATGNGSFATGYNTKAEGQGSTALGALNAATGLTSTAMGVANTASGQASNVMGFQNTASGDAATAAGIGVQASGNGSVGLGAYLTAKSGGEVVVGTGNTNYTPISSTGFDPADRAFVVGIGEVQLSGVISNKDGLIVYKSGNTDIGGQIKVNANTATNTFTLPTTRGTANQVLATDGAGTTIWTTPASVPSVTFLFKNAAYTITSTDLTNNLIIQDESTSGVNYTLPSAAAAGIGKQVTIVNRYRSAFINVVRHISSQWAGIIDNTPTVGAVGSYKRIVLVSDGVNKWYIIDSEQ